MRYEYPQEALIFRSGPSEWCMGGVIVAHGPSLAHPDCIVTDDDIFAIEILVPLTIAAVLLYESCGGTLDMALAASSFRRGRKPDRLFARAHAYQAMKTELGEGC